MYSEFTNLYPVSKTLRFLLIPQYETSENMKKNGITDMDILRKEKYHQAKPILDEIHRRHINNVMEGYSADWTELYDALLQYQKDKNKAPLEKVQKKYRDGISKAFKTASQKLNANEIIRSVKNNEIELDAESRKLILYFEKFSTYFINYDTSRKNMYASDGSTAVAHRIVMDVFPQFVSNIKTYAAIPEELVKEIEEETEIVRGGYSLSEVFSVEHFNTVLTQNGIDAYNTLLGGFNTAETEKQKGVNECCNLLYQQKKLERKLLFKPLHKQILSQKESVSFLPTQFTSDEELISALKAYSMALKDRFDSAHEQMLQCCDTSNVTLSQIYVDKKQLAKLSMLLFDTWYSLGENLNSAKVSSQNIYDLLTLQKVCDTDILTKLKEGYLAYTAKHAETEKAMLSQLDKNGIGDYSEIKAYLDNVIELQKHMQIFAAEDSEEKAADFYPCFDNIYSELRNVIPLYNKVRNYATRKPYSTEKFKLNFENPTLLNGWDQNKEAANFGILLRKGGAYYLGIMKAGNKPKFKENDGPLESDDYQKMVYKYLPGPNKMLPWVFFSKEGLKTFGYNSYIDEGYKSEKHKKGDNFDIKFCRDLIDYFKEKISEHPDWSKFGFKYSDTSTYENISEFYNEISAQNYKIRFSYISDREIRKAVSEGKLYLFQIYNKDFSESSTGKPNMHTVYWRELFSEENLKKSILRLNGEAEVFYRPASVSNVFIHKKSSVLANKKDKEGKAIPSDRYSDIAEDIQSGITLTELESKYPEASFRPAPHDIVKDKRYTKDSIQFHVPITLNAVTEENEKMKYNERVLSKIYGRDDIRIIGIDRGERNLIYVSCIDTKGNIIKQRSLNVINQTDYHEKMDRLETERKNEKRNWSAITKIKDVKAGYLSQAVHEIVEMMLESPSVLVMEDLNFGFKQSRVHIEKQIYQKFEKALIEKLKYCVSKDRSADDAGGVRHAYQLADNNYRDGNRQCGFIFYVPPRNTSKIDYKTGFVNHFTSTHLNYQSVAASKDFFEKFDSITYNSEKDCFCFDFDYRSFIKDCADHINRWTVCTHGDERLVHTKINGYDSTEAVNVTEMLKRLLQENQIDYRDTELKKAIAAQDSKDFFKKLLWLLKITLQLRYEDKNNDYILSPIEKDGEFYDTRRSTRSQPTDGDANGAYHIALSGLRLIKEQIDTNGESYKLTSDEKGKQFANYLRFVQAKEYQS